MTVHVNCSTYCEFNIFQAIPLGYVGKISLFDAANVLMHNLRLNLTERCQIRQTSVIVFDTATTTALTNNDNFINFDFVAKRQRHKQILTLYNYANIKC